MKVINASSSLSHISDIDISNNKILLGNDPRALMATIVMSLAIILGIVAPGTFWFYWVAGIVVSVLAYSSTPDNRKSYSKKQIAKAGITGHERVSKKRAGGSIGGAAVGGLIFGGAGAVVGAIAGGNEVSDYKNAFVEFTDGNWIVFGGESDGIESQVQFRSLAKLAGSKWVR